MASPPPEPERPCRRRASIRSLRCSSVGATHSCHPTGGFHRCMCSRSSTPHQRQPLGAGIRRSDPSVDIATPSPDHILPATTDITPPPDRPAETRTRADEADAAESRLSCRSPTVAISGAVPLAFWPGALTCADWAGQLGSRRRADTAGDSSTTDPTTVSCRRLRPSALSPRSGSSASLIDTPAPSR